MAFLGQNAAEKIRMLINSRIQSGLLVVQDSRPKVQLQRGPIQDLLAKAVGKTMGVLRVLGIPCDRGDPNSKIRPIWSRDKPSVQFKTIATRPQDEAVLATFCADSGWTIEEAPLRVLLPNLSLEQFYAQIR